MNKMCYIHTGEYYLVKKKEWSTDKCYNMGEPEKKMLSKKVSYQKSHIIWYHIYEMSRIGKSTKTENRLVIVQEWRDGMERKVDFFLVGKNGDKKCFKINCDNGCTTLWTYTKSYWVTCMVHKLYLNKVVFKSSYFGQAPLAHTCNPSNSRDRDQEDHGSRLAQINSSWNPALKRAGGMVQVVEFLLTKCKALSLSPSTTKKEVSYFILIL
jgi:hypothetical protein